MRDDDIRSFIIEQLKERLDRSGIGNNEIKNDFDLVQSGLLDSMSFVDLISGAEEYFKLEIDYESALETGNFTTIAGIILAFKDHLNE